MKQVNLMIMPTINKDNIFREYKIIYKELRKEKGGKKAGKFLTRSFLSEVRSIISAMPKAEYRPFAEKVSKFLENLQSEGFIDLRRFSKEEGLDLMRLLYDVQEFYEDKIQADTPRMPMEFMFPYHLFPRGSRVVIYGAGNVGRLIYRQAKHDNYVRIVGIVDKNCEGMSAPDLHVKPVRSVLKMEYDYLLISIRDSKVAHSVREKLKKMGIPAAKIKWDGYAVFRDDFYNNFYFPLLRKMKNVHGDHKTFLKTFKASVGKSATGDADEICSGYYDSIRSLVEAMPDSNGSRYYKPLDKTIGWITDPFAYDAYFGSAPSVLLTPDEWEEQIEQIDVLFVVTGWRGFNEEWRGFAIPGSEKQELICNIVEICNKRGIPTVFYSKEDPVSYERYIKIAKLCKYVFTSAVEKVEDYLQDCGHDRVSCLNFGMNPHLHNPIGMKKYPKRSEVVFAGSWYDKYPVRCADTEILFNGVLDSGRFLRIISRNSDITNGKYRFPDKYLPFLAPAIEHRCLQKVHKLHDWAINLNSVKDSQTMFAARLYELMASGNLLLSNYSLGANSRLPLAFLCQDSKEIPDILNCLTPEEIYEHQIAGVRFAYKGNTCYERLQYIMSALDEGTEISRKVAVVVAEDDDEAKLMFEHQSYPDKEMVTEDELKSNYDQFDMVAFFRSGSYYGDFYLEDMINAFKYTDSDYVTKAAYYDGEKYIYGAEHDYVSEMPDKYRTVFWSEAFTANNLLEMQGSVSLPNGYSIDHFMYNEKILPEALTEEKPLLSVIVPIYNNGIHLYGKCFSSLRRSSIFRQMEIILVDDGSTDNYTPAVIRSLAHAYPNVRTYFYEEGGSGSASRPRNKGVEMATADYITFLDPDNEAVNDAYAKMLSVAQEEDRELVLGEIDRFDTVEKRWKLGYALKLIYNSDEVAGGKDFIEKLSFRAMSIQAMVIKKSFLASTGIRQVEGAIGQDTLFAWQLFYYAQQIKYVPVVAHIYYAGRDNSVLNDVTVRFFEKYLLLEKERVAWLRETGLLKSYNEIRFAYYFNGLYLRKLASVAEENKQRCIDILREIVKMYEVDGKIDDEVITDFMELGITEYKSGRKL